MELPQLPARIVDFIPYLSEHPNTNTAVEPFKTFEGKLREVYAREPSSTTVADPHVNTVPLFAGHEQDLRIRARDVDSETTDQKDKYLLALSKADRKANGSPALVPSFKEFKSNFSIFSESSLVDLDWSNVVAAGSSVVTSLLPVPVPHNESKRALRAYYHEELAPASDVDLFLYGLSEEGAKRKIKQIETSIRDSILTETTTIRTKNAITIASQYPTRHVQIVLRIYKSVSEILTGFDVDCSCVAYDGKQVWATPRAIAAYVTQINSIDLTRRSPSYENRLSKYSRRGFEVYWPALDRCKIDPTIFERSFSRVMGLARLLVLEKLPHQNDRDSYLAKRRRERGRPALPWNARYRHQLPGNVKDAQPDDEAEWVEADDVSNYHTFTVPYGLKYTAKKIEKLLFTKDLLLNAEWNQSKARDTKLHRHPAFFGSVDDVFHDCCGFCPQPETDEDFATLEEEEKIYISGDIKFIVDDPGRQAIGSFHPITDNDWTEMAYVGNTARLCQAIVDCDLEHVEDWCNQEGSDVNTRDHTGRTPLQLAAMCSTIEILQCLIDHGARIVSRLVDGFTALHIAATRGNASMVKALLEKSVANEEEEYEKEEARKDARRKVNATKPFQGGPDDDDEESASEDIGDSDGDLMDDNDSDDSDRITDGSFVKVDGSRSQGSEIPEDIRDEPDIYDVDVLAWDSPVSPLHLAILGSHLEVIEMLIDDFGADVLLPVKLFHEHDRRSPKAAILTVALALQRPLQEANNIISMLLAHGASSTQVDMNNHTALHFVINEGKTLILDTLLEHDGPAVTKAVNHIVLHGWEHNLQVNTPLLTAIRIGSLDIISKLLSNGARPEINFEQFSQAYHSKFARASQDPEQMRKIFQKSIEQPIVAAARADMPELVQKLLGLGVDANTLPKAAYERAEFPDNTYLGDDKSLLDVVRSRLMALKEYAVEENSAKFPTAPEPLQPDNVYLAGLDTQSYSYWLAKHDLDQAKGIHAVQMKEYRKEIEELNRVIEAEGEAAKKKAVQNLIPKVEKVLHLLEEKGAKTFYQIFAEISVSKEPEQRNRNYYGQDSQYNSEPYANKLSFLVADLTPTKKDEYLQLFEACWKGDLDTVKLLTTVTGGGGRPPLQISICDLRGFTPFSIAMIRGHHMLAKTILEISNAQYSPREDAQRFKYSILSTNDEENASTDSDDDKINIHAELIDETCIVEDIAALSSVIKSNISPMEFLSSPAEMWRAIGGTEKAAKATLMPGPFKDVGYLADQTKQSWTWFHMLYQNESQRCRWSLVRYAIAKNDMGMLKHLLQFGSELAGRQLDPDAPKVFTVLQDDFLYAARLGRTEMIGEIIRTTGAAIPLHKLAEKSGVQVQEKPKYYQGLSVHGKKRQDWADAGRGLTRAPVENEQSPLLSVAFEGNIETVEYFLSDAPLRRYQEFAAMYKSDKRIQTLAQAKGGISKALTTWLETRKNLVVHMAVLSKPGKDGTNPLLDFFIRNMPEVIDVRSSSGATPLQLALELKRYNAAEALIRAGANQATRNLLGENIIHTIIKSGFNGRADLLRSILAILDPKLVESMLLEKCGGTDPGALTPMALLAHIACPYEDCLDVILSYSRGKDLEIMDGAGDYVLHTLVEHSRTRTVKYVINYNPSLLYRENAVGRTPLDVINTKKLRSRIENPPQIQEIGRYRASSRFPSGILEKNPREFIQKDKTNEEYRSTWEMCNEMAALLPEKRHLVSLLDANEVAKRLADQQVNKNERGYGIWGETVGEKDEVEMWKRTAERFTKRDLKMWEEERTDYGKEVRDKELAERKKRQDTPESDSEEL